MGYPEKKKTQDKAVPVDDLPTEISELKSSPEDALLPAPGRDPFEAIKLRIEEIGIRDLVVVEARVEDVAASARALPSELLWEEGEHIVSCVELKALRSFHGDYPDPVRASYVGGKLPDGRSERNEMMPKDLRHGEIYVFFLRKIEGEIFLELGQKDMLCLDAQGNYLDASGNSVSPDKLQALVRQ